MARSYSDFHSSATKTLGKSTIKSASDWWVAALNEQKSRTKFQALVYFRKSFPGVLEYCTVNLPDLTVQEAIQIVLFGPSRCEHCGAEVFRLDNVGLLSTRSRFCSSRCSGLSDVVQGKAVKTNLSRYGVGNPMQNSWVKEKARNVCREKYGGPSSASDPEIRERQKVTWMERHGINSESHNRLIRSKQVETSLRNYGVDHPMRSPEVKSRAVSTNCRKYGGPSPMSDPDIAKAAGKKISRSLLRGFASGRLSPPSHGCFSNKKEFITSDNRSIVLQGFEPQVAVKLEEAGFRIEACSVRVPYKHGGRDRVYIPDFVAVSPAGRKYLVEVKSTWTLKKEEVRSKARFARRFCRKSPEFAGYKVVLYDKSFTRLLKQISTKESHEKET